MIVITKEELHSLRNIIFQKIENGAIFIHPTDTIYGIGCNALNSNAVKRIREIKGRHITPFSVIAPSKEWIFENCRITDEAREWIAMLPGPYTLVLNKKDTTIAEEVTPGIDTIGVRIPDHWFSEVVNKFGFPIVTTSANLVHENFMTSLDNLDIRIKSHVDFIIYEGVKEGRPSRIIHLGDEMRIIER